MHAPVLALMSLLAAAPQDAAQTRVDDPQSKALLLGEHPFTLQWIEGAPGKATVTEKDGLLTIEGEQRKGANWVTIKGAILEVKSKQFVLQGKVESQVSYIAAGKPCAHDGRLTFLIAGGRKYWRLVEMNNRCEEVVDYVDVHFAAAKKAPRVQLLSDPQVDAAVRTRVGEALAKAGFAASSTDTAKKAHQVTTVYFGKGFQDQAQAIAKLTPREAKVQALTWQAEADIVVVVGIDSGGGP